MSADCSNHRKERASGRIAVMLQEPPATGNTLIDAALLDVQAGSESDVAQQADQLSAALQVLQDVLQSSRTTK